MLAQPSPLYTAGVDTAGLGRLDIEVFDVFEPLEQSWRELEKTGVCSIYQHYDWVYNWARLVGQPARVRPRIIVGKSNGIVAFILGMGLRQRGPFTILTWVGDSHTNFHMGLYSENFLQAAKPDDVRNIISCITKNVGHADVLELCCQPVSWNGHTNPFTFLPWQQSHNHAFALDISEGFEAALNRKNGARKRKKHRSQRNKLKAVGGAHLRIASTESEIDTFLDTSFNQMAHRFNKAGIWNTFEDDGIDPFIRGLAKSSLGKDTPELRVYGLEIDGKLRATFAGGLHRGQFSGCFISFSDDEYTHISPGELIMYLVIEDCVNRGIEMFDLGRGEERYKTSWCDRTITMFDTNIALTKLAFAYTGYERVKSTIKRVVRNNHTLWNYAKIVRAKFYGRF